MREMWRTPIGRGFVALAVLAAAFGFASNAQNSIVTNYLDGVLGLSGPQFGYWTAIREMGGLLLFLLTAVFYRVSLQKLTAGAMIAFGIGCGLFVVADGFWTVIPWTLLSSFGLHLALQTQISLGLSLTTEDKSGSVLGRMGAITQVGTFAALLMVFFVFQFDLFSFEPTFVILAAVAVVGALAILPFPHLHEGRLSRFAPRREPMVFRREYSHYYRLVFLDGARAQVFFSFGLWVLVNRFGLGVASISVVMMAVTFGCMVSASWLGRWIDRAGERRSLSIVNLAYVVALGGFALSHNVWMACVFYLIYAVIAPLSYMGASTYLRKIATASDLAPSLSMGLTMQHLAAIVVPVTMGFTLNFVGYQIPFYVACGVAAITFFVTLRLDPAKQKCAARIAADETAAAEAAAARSTTAEAAIAELATVRASE